MFAISQVISTTIWGSRPLEIAFDKGIEIVKNRGYLFNNNFHWNEIKVAGIKVNEESWKGFLQICERLVGDFGNFKIYVDAEVRVMWVYTDPDANEADKEAYYVQFP